MKKSLSFKSTSKPKEVVEVFNYNSTAFSDSPDFPWTLESLERQIKDGWKLYSAKFGEEVVAAIFAKPDKDRFLTRNTPIKITFQGNGFSHQIKEFLEEEARKGSFKKIVNYCRVDNFRGISLNETHGYKRTGAVLGEEKQFEEWEKVLS